MVKSFTAICIFAAGSLIAGALSYIARQQIPPIPPHTCSDFNPYTCQLKLGTWGGGSASTSGPFWREMMAEGLANLESSSPESIREQGSALGLSAAEIEKSITEQQRSMRERELARKLNMPADFVERNFAYVERLNRVHDLSEKLGLPVSLVEKNMETIERNLPSVDPVAVMSRCKCIPDSEKKVVWKKESEARSVYRTSLIIVALTAIPIAAITLRKALPFAKSLPGRAWQFILRRIKEIAAAFRGNEG
jgi:hypothetical protein